VGSSSGQRRYVTSQRVKAIDDQLSQRQRELLADVGRLGVVSAAQLQRLHYPATEVGRRLSRQDLSTLGQLGVLSRLDRLIGGVRAGSAGHVYALGTAGQRLLNPGQRRYRPPWTPQPSYLRHALSVSELYVSLRETEHRTGLNLISFDTEPKCWKSFSGPGGSRLVLKPDAMAVLHLGDFEDRYLIEADCSTESGPRILSKARIYVRYSQSGREQAASGVFPFVLWVTPSEKRKDFLIGVLAGLPPEQRQLFLVATSTEAAERIATGSATPITRAREVK